MNKSIENGNYVCLKPSVVSENDLSTNVGVIAMSEAQAEEGGHDLEDRQFNVELEDGTLVENVHYHMMSKLHGIDTLVEKNKPEPEQSEPEPTIVDTFLDGLRSTALEDVLKDVIDRHSSLDLDDVSSYLDDNLEIDTDIYEPKISSATCWDNTIEVEFEEPDSYDINIHVHKRVVDALRNYISSR